MYARSDAFGCGGVAVSQLTSAPAYRAEGHSALRDLRDSATYNARRQPSAPVSARLDSFGKSGPVIYGTYAHTIIMAGASANVQQPASSRHHGRSGIGGADSVIRFRLLSVA